MVTLRGRLFGLFMVFSRGNLCGCPSLGARRAPLHIDSGTLSKGAPYFPVNLGSRFSTKARIASLWSSVEKHCFSSASEVSSTKLAVSRRILLTETLVQRIALVGPLARRVANAIAVDIN